MRRLNKSRTDDNRLVYIRVSNLYRADYTIDAVGATRFFEYPSKDVSGYALLHQSKNARGIMIEKYIELSLQGSVPLPLYPNRSEYS